jgi:hypothetical protein
MHASFWNSCHTSLLMYVQRLVKHLTWKQNHVYMFCTFYFASSKLFPFLNVWYLVNTFWILIGYHKEKIEENNRSFEKWKMLASTKIVMFFETPTHRIMPCNVPCKYKRKKKLLWCEVHNIYFALVCLFHSFWWYDHFRCTCQSNSSWQVHNIYIRSIIFIYEAT